MFSRFYRHPWALEATVGRRAIGPNELGWMEEAVAALAGTGLDGGEMLDVAATLTGHVRAIAQQRSALADGRPEQAMAAVMTGLLSGRQERFPALTAAFGSAAEHGSRTRPSTSVSPASWMASGCSSPAASRQPETCKTNPHPPDRCRAPLKAP